MFNNFAKPRPQQCTETPLERPAKPHSNTTWNPAHRMPRWQSHHFSHGITSGPTFSKIWRLQPLAAASLLSNPWPWASSLSAPYRRSSPIVSECSLMGRTRQARCSLRRNCGAHDASLKRLGRASVSLWTRLPTAFPSSITRSAVTYPTGAGTRARLAEFQCASAGDPSEWKRRQLQTLNRLCSRQSLGGSTLHNPQLRFEWTLAAAAPQPIGSPLVVLSLEAQSVVGARVWTTVLVCP